MKEYLIDGNNLIGKVPFLQSLQKRNKESARERLIFIIERYFHTRNIKVKVYFDGYANIAIKPDKVTIKYSNSKSADEIMKNDIGTARNPRNLVVVSSDNEIAGFSRVCAAESVLSEKFYGMIEKTEVNEMRDEYKRIDELSNSKNEFVKLFGVERNEN